MLNPSVRNILRRERMLSPGKVVTASSHFDGHANRMASHIHRVWNHTCERIDGKRCGDCIYRRSRW